MTTTNELGGLRIDGDRIAGYQAKDQHEDHIFIDALLNLLNTESVKEVRWQQYTPHFNDGDACVFSVYDAYVKTTFSGEDEGDYEDGFLASWELHDYEQVGEQESTRNVWDSTKGGYRTETYVRPVYDYKSLVYASDDHERVDKALSAFASVLCSGHHDNLLLRKFGDHARVTATKEGIEIEEYYHD